MGNNGTTRCLAPLPVTVMTSPSGSTAPVNDSASAMRSPAP